MIHPTPTHPPGLENREFGQYTPYPSLLNTFNSLNILFQEEEGLPLSFLKDLHSRHEDWLVHGKYPLPAPVVVLDGNLGLEQFTTTVNAWVEAFQYSAGISG